MPWGKFLIFGVLLVGCVVAKAPASKVDELLINYTDSRLRLLQPEGTLWHGKGLLASQTLDGRSLVTWLPLTWDIDPASISHLSFIWNFKNAGIPFGKVEVSSNEFSLQEVQLNAPLEAVTAISSEPLARIGWHGDISLNLANLNCTKLLKCDGKGTVLWKNAHADPFPGRAFGDYQVVVVANKGNIEYSLKTLDGEIKAVGDGTVSHSGTYSFKGTVIGDPEFLKRLPNITDGKARATEEPGKFQINISNS
ncbi:type II secretion system protein N [Methylophilus sp. 3sh_L]|uniref:type II secretion system protein N n=1 Tax=Methylophilus sp. 3sh_L TaxID=3377114 RepID=UPI00398E8956